MDEPLARTHALQGEVIEAFRRATEALQQAHAVMEQLLEMADDAEWDRQFAATPDTVFEKLSAEIHAEFVAGRTTPLDPDCL